MKVTVGISEIQYSNSPEDLIVTYSLGSCVAVSVYDPVARVGGMIHYMLPNAAIDVNKASKIPAMFGDTGIPLLFENAYRLGAIKERMRVTIAGGAHVVNFTNEAMDIGRRNVIIARKLFWKNRVLIKGESVEGEVARTMYLDMKDGSSWVITQGRRIDL